MALSSKALVVALLAAAIALSAIPSGAADEESTISVKEEMMKKRRNWAENADEPTSEVGLNLEILGSDESDPNKKGHAAEALARLLKAGDDRLIKSSATEGTVKIQREVMRYGGVKVLADTFVDIQSSLALKIMTLECLYLMTVDNPKVRDMVRQAGVLEVVGEMLTFHKPVQNSPTKVRGNEMAAEAAYILAYNNAGSIRELTRLGAITKLIVLASSGKSERAKMWACAALQNIGADYPESRLYSSQQRQTMISYGAVPILVALVNTGPSSLPPSEETEDLADHMGIAAWAAAGALKNLALSKDSHPAIRRFGGVEALEKLKTSKDTLESSKASVALRRLIASQRDEL